MTVLDAIRELMNKHPEYRHDNSFVVPHNAIEQGRMLERLEEAGGPHFDSMHQLYEALTYEGSSLHGTDSHGIWWQLPPEQKGE